MKARRAVYPGTFDPPTLGHLDLIRRASGLFERITVLVAANSSKMTWFAAEERVRMIRDEVAEFSNVEVDEFSGLIVDYMRAREIRFMLRGLRTVSDFEYEYQMAMTNRSLLSSSDTVFMMPSLCYSYTSSRLIKDVVKHGADVSAYVTPRVAAAMAARLKERVKGQSKPD